MSWTLGATWNIVASVLISFPIFYLILLLIYPCFRYNCNRYDEDEARSNRDSQERSRAALQRYLFYCNRYMNHMQSLRLEHKLYATVKEKMEEMQQHNMSWIEVCSAHWSGRFLMLLMHLSCISPGSISEKGSGYSMPMQADADVHIRLCLLSKEKQSVGYFRSKSF